MALDKKSNCKTYCTRSKRWLLCKFRVGIPTLVTNFVREDISVEFQSENGVLGMGPFLLKEKKMRTSSMQVNKRSLLYQEQVFRFGV